MPIRPGINLSDLLEILRMRRWYVILCSLFVFLCGTIYYVTAPKRYKSVTTILVIPQRVPESYVRSTVSTRIEDRLATMRQQVMSRTRLMKVMEELNLFTVERKQRPLEEMVEKMRNRIDLQVRGNDAFTLSFVHEDRNLAMLTASRLASYFIEENLKIREQQAVGTSEFLDSQLQETKKKLESQEHLVQQYKMRFMGELPQQMESNLATLNRFQDRFRTIADSIRASEDRKLFYESQLNALKRATQPARTPQTTAENVVVPADPALALVNDLWAKRVRLDELTGKYTDRHPEVRSLRNDIQALEKRIAESRASAPPAENASARQLRVPPPANDPNPALTQEFQRLVTQIQSAELELTTLRKEREEIKNTIAAVQAKVDSAPKREQEMFAITRDYENVKRSYDDLLRKKLDAEVSQNLEKRQKGEQFQILDPANLPQEPFSPAKMVVMAVCILAACLLGCGGAVGLEYMDKTLKSADEFRRFFDLPVLVSLPVLQEPAAARREKIRSATLACLAAAIAVFVVVLLVFGHDVVTSINTRWSAGWTSR